MSSQKIDTQKMYAIIADTMPVEGRDFTISVVGGGGDQRLVINPLTDVGRGFVPVLVERLSAQSGNRVVTVASATAVARETETVNTLRAAIEKEETEALRAKLATVVKKQSDEREAMEREDKARGSRTMTQDESRNRSEHLSNIHKLVQQQRQMQYMLDHLQEARERVKEASISAAEADARSGNDWGIDQDAPLTTLFDREDASDKLRRLEVSIQQLAAYMFMVKDVTANAAAIGKQYVMKK